MSGLLKQFSYSIFYLLILSGIGAGVYFWFLRPTPTCFDNKLNQGEEEADCGGPCVSCALKKIKPLEILPSQIFEVSAAATTALVQIRNPNSTHGAAGFKYALNFYDVSNNTILSLNDASFIYPDETRTLIFPNLEVAFSKIIRIDFMPSEINWVPASVFPRPEIEVSTESIKLVKGQVVIDGRAKNKGPAVIAKAVIGAAIMNKSGLFVDASRTVLDGISPFGSATFRIFIPVTAAESKTLDLTKTKLSVEAAR